MPPSKRPARQSGLAGSIVSKATNPIGSKRQRQSSPVVEDTELSHNTRFGGGRSSSDSEYEDSECSSDEMQNHEKNDLDCASNGFNSRYKAKPRGEQGSRGVAQQPFSVLQNCRLSENEHSFTLPPVIKTEGILKSDHASRPLWVSSDCSIFMEISSPFYAQAYDFVISIAEPIRRPQYIHEYQITKMSLQSAIVIGLTPANILKRLEILCKTVLPVEVKDYIVSETRFLGKIKLVLAKLCYYVEVLDEEALDAIASDEDIMLDLQRCREGIPGSDTPAHQTRDQRELQEALNDVERGFHLSAEAAMENEAELGILEDLIANNDVEESNSVVFKVKDGKHQVVRERLYMLGFPLVQEYDFTNDSVTPPLPITLKMSARLRSYQMKCLGKVFTSKLQRARSGIIVLPCGAGKTLVGVAIAAYIRRSVLVVCNNSMSVQQWCEQFSDWSTMAAEDVCTFVSKSKTAFARPVTITTYSMMLDRKRSLHSESMMDSILNQHWGLVVLDEVHTFPADKIMSIMDKVRAHCKIGLTATLVREDNLIEKLKAVVGSKLYEANWQDLVKGGYLADVKCSQVSCPMSPKFMKAYCKMDSETGSHSMRKRLWNLNPYKYLCTEYLIKRHEQRGDKILILIDDIQILKLYSQLLDKPAMHGKTPIKERLSLLSSFKQAAGTQTLILSRVGDLAIDLPDAAVLIQVTAHFASRMQETQRFGRILRKKSTGDNTACFYTLVSKDTKECYYSLKRQQYLVGQGYAYEALDFGKIVINSNTTEEQDHFKRVEALCRLRLLEEVEVSEEQPQNEEDAYLDDPGEVVEQLDFTMTSTNLALLSGGV